jgi:hypothetical protein
MTEPEWLSCPDPQLMLEWLRGKISGRKVRLFDCACVRRVWHLLTDERSRHAVQLAERLADEPVDEGEWCRAVDSARQAYQEARAASRPGPATSGTPGAARRWAAYVAAWGVLGSTQHGPKARFVPWAVPEARAEEERGQCILLRDIFGNPFRPAALDPAWLTPDVLSLAQAAYEERQLPAGELDPARLGLLADALEDAGCDSAEILGHLRSPGVHVRGCWPVDIILGKG